MQVVPTYQCNAILVGTGTQAFLRDRGPFVCCARSTRTLPKSVSAHEHVFVVTDRFTKFTREIPLKSTMSQAVTEAFLPYWAHAYGVSDRLVSDNVPQLTMCYFQHALASLEINYVPTSSTTYRRIARNSNITFL